MPITFVSFTLWTRNKDFHTPYEQRSAAMSVTMVDIKVIKKCINFFRHAYNLSLDYTSFIFIGNVFFYKTAGQ